MQTVFKVLGKVTGDEDEDDIEDHGTESKSSNDSSHLLKLKPDLEP